MIGWIGAALGIVNKGLGLLRGQQKKAERAEMEQHGRTAENLTQHQEASDAKARMDDVGDPDSDGLADSLRRDKF